MIGLYSNCLEYVKHVWNYFCGSGMLTQSVGRSRAEEEHTVSNLWTFWLTGLGLSWLGSTLLWLYSLRSKDASVIDIFWGPGFLLLALCYAVSSGDVGPRGWLVLVLVALWGLRLAAHIAIRSRGAGEDPRYRKWRAEHGERWWWRSYLQVFLLQTVLLNLVGLPLLFALSTPGASPFGAWDLVGLTLWLVGFLFEALADYQLLRFKRDPANRGAVLDAGLWRFSRHPNYFGEMLLWWGFGSFSLAAGGILGLAGSALITLLLLAVSGVTLLERTILESKPHYRDYVRRTSAFVPWKPRA